MADIAKLVAAQLAAGEFIVDLKKRVGDELAMDVCREVALGYLYKVAAEQSWGAMESFVRERLAGRFVPPKGKENIKLVWSRGAA